MRVQVYIPGTVESYCIDERGDKRVATDELWLETYLCSVLRAYSYADDGSGDTIKKIIQPHHKYRERTQVSGCG
ncbi:unnamed protein product [Alternaria alternata]